ncbi:MAG: response regulator [Vicinamibacterales bacterium]
MSVPLRLLLVEDNADDAELVTRGLRKAGLDVLIHRVDTAAEFAGCLDQGTWDIVICDHVVPGFGSARALGMLRARDADLPFIVVSGRMGEEAAVEALTAGADDYVMKDRLGRLPAAVTRAIAHRALLQQQRQHAEAVQRARTMEALGTLAAGIAHDVNNILTAVLVNARLAGEQDDVSLARAHLEQVCLAAERGRELVTRTLAFGRPQGGDRAPVRLADVVGEVAALLRPGLPPTVVLRTETPSDGSCVVADRAQMFQVVMNLASNAVQAIESGTGSVTLALSEVTLTGAHAAAGLPPGRYVRLTVADTGTGMTAATAARVFEPFFTTRAMGQGTGLGLSTVHQLVCQHAGTVTVESEPGRGATFRVFLPAGPLVLRPDVVTEPAAVGDIPGGSGHILYVEDEVLVALATTRYLRSLGYQVTDAPSGGAAIDRVLTGQEPYDMLLTDQHLPEMSGLELARRMASLRPGLPVLVASGLHPGEQQLAEANVRHWLAKPYTDRALARAVARTLATRDDPAAGA